MHRLHHRNHATRFAAPPVADELFVAAPPRLRDRLAERLLSHRLDQALADGAAEESNPALALRARRLTQLTCRRALADTLVSLIDVSDSARPPAASRVRIDPRRSRVREAAGELRRVAEELRRPGPARAQGVAQVQILLVDGAGPLYNPHCAASVAQRARLALDDLRAA